MCIIGAYKYEILKYIYLIFVSQTNKHIYVISIDIRYYKYYMLIRMNVQLLESSQLKTLQNRNITFIY